MERLGMACEVLARLFGDIPGTSRKVRRVPEGGDKVAPGRLATKFRQRALRLVSVVVGVTMFSLLAAGQAEEWNYRTQTEIDWRQYGTDAFSEAGASGRPVFVLVYADWCAWCKKYELETLEQPPIRRRLEREWVPVAVDYDENPELARRLGVKLVPTTLLLTPEAKKLQRFFGLIDARALAENLDRVRDMWRRGEIPEADFGDESTCCPLVPPQPGAGEQ